METSTELVADCGLPSFEQALAPLLAPPGAAAASLVSPRLAQAWAEVLVMHWGRVERLAGLDLSQPLYVLDFAPGDGSLAAWMLPALQDELHARGMSGWPVRYVLCPLPGAPSPEPLLLSPQLHGFLAAGWLDRASWQARTGQPLLLGSQRYPLFGARNPVAALCAGGLSGLPAQLYGVHFGKLARAHLVAGAPAADGQVPLDCEWQPLAAAELRAHDQAALLAGYRCALANASVLLSEPAFALVDALADFSAGRYLLLAADRGAAGIAGIRDGELALPAAAARAQLQLPVNFHALASHQEAAGARAANLRWGELPAVLHLACRDQQLGLDDAGWNALLLRADRGHPADRWWHTEGSGCGIADELAFRLRASGHDPWVLALLLHQLEDAPPDAFALAGEAALAALRHNLRETWRRVRPGPGNEAFLAALLGLLFQLADWPLAREVLAAAPAGLQLQRARLALACGDTPAALTHLRDHLEREPADAAGCELQQQLRLRLQQRDASPWRGACEQVEGQLRLEPLDGFHVPAWLHQLRDASIMQLAGLPPVTSAQQACAWLDEVAATAGAEFALMHAELGFVGAVGARVLEDMAHLHFWIGADHQGRGFGGAALRLLCGVLRAAGLQHALASVHAGNERARLALARAGFQAIDLEETPGNGHVLLHLPLRGMGSQFQSSGEHHGLEQ